MHAEGFEKCSMVFNFFATSADQEVNTKEEDISAQLTVVLTHQVTDTAGEVVLSRKQEAASDYDEASEEGHAGWVVNATKPGTYRISVKNQGYVPTTGIVMVNFQNCKKFKKLVKKTDMDEINARADTAIGTLFHNMVELEHSESRLALRKEGNLG